MHLLIKLVESFKVHSLNKFLYFSKMRRRLFLVLLILIPDMC